MRIRTPYVIVASWMAVNGLGFLLVPQRYTTGSFAVLKDVAPLRWWGAAWLIAAVCALMPHRWWAAFMAIGTSAAFTVGYAGAVVTHQTQAPTTWASSAAITALMIWRTGKQE